MAHPLDSIFRPRSIAVVGASRSPTSIGWLIMDNLLRFGFTGPLYPVNPNADAIHSLKAYPSVDAIPDAVDLVVVVVPHKLVQATTEACARKGVRGMVVITAGFRETGTEGAGREKAVVDTARAAGIRIVGPNCMGVINTEAGFRMDATFAGALPIPGSVAFLTQSGALGVTILHQLRALNLGLSQFVSIGNKADVEIHELLDFWADEDATTAVLLYLESFGEPVKFAASARRLTRKKPLMVVKAGRTREGALAAVSHTGSLAGLEVAQDALLEGVGALRVANVQELFDLARAFVHQPLPRSRRVGILTNGGGPGILAADACASLGLEIPPLSEATRTRIARGLSPDASLQNPVDMIASATVEQYELCVQEMLRDPAIDSLVVLCVPPANLDVPSVARALQRIAADATKTVLGCLMGVDDADLPPPTGMRRVPIYPYPEQAAQALYDLVKYRAYRDRAPGTIPRLTVDSPAAAAAWAEAQAASGPQVPFPILSKLLSAYEIQVAESALCATSEEALAAANRFGFPVVMKAFAPDLLHKTDIGGVIAGVKSPLEAEGAFQRLHAAWAKAGRAGPLPAVLVQRMVPGGVETIVGATEAPGVGRMVMFGLGGVFTEVIRDVAFRLHPLTDVDAAETVRSIRGLPLLTGHRGSPPSDIPALERTLLRVSALLTDCPAISELDLNPLFVLPAGLGTIVADARMAIRSER